MKIKFEFNWFDLWVGAYWNSWGRRLYVQIIPMCTIIVQFHTPPCDYDDMESEQRGIR